jgi:hypothetical protein
MSLKLRTRILLGLAVLTMCIVASPLPVPAESPPASPPVAATESEGVEQARNAQARAVADGDDEARGLQRAVVPNLPFTGLDLLVLLGVAAALALMAWTLHRLSAPR